MNSISESHTSPFYTAFIVKYGRKLFHELLSSFRSCAIQTHDRVSTGELNAIFSSVGKGVPISKLENWLKQSRIDVNVQLCFADVLMIFSNFFALNETELQHVGGNSISEVVIAWLRRISPTSFTGGDATHSLVRAICAGRSMSVVDLVCRFRDGFEKLDKTSCGVLSYDLAATLLHDAGVDASKAKIFLARLVPTSLKVTHHGFTLADLFETCGSLIEDLAVCNLSVKDSLGLLQLNLKPNDFYQSIKFMAQILRCLIDNPANNKFWKIDIDAPKFQSLIWRHNGGQQLMLAAGYEGPFEYIDNMGRKRQFLEVKWKSRRKTSMISQLEEEQIEHFKAALLEVTEILEIQDGSSDINRVWNIVKQNSSGLQLKNALNWCLTIIENLLKSPSQWKNYRIKTENKIFIANIGSLSHAQFLMEFIGFSLKLGDKLQNVPAMYFFRSVGRLGAGWSMQNCS
jgi:hypothetical protein